VTRKNFRRPYQPSLIDLAILDLLPPQGSHLGLHKLGMTVPGLWETLREKYKDDTLTKPGVSGRCLSLTRMKMAVGIMLVPTRDGYGYQITEAGAEMLEKHREELEEVKKGG
jgi:hypothetical protein